MLSDIDGCECQEAARLDDEPVECAYDAQVNISPTVGIPMANFCRDITCLDIKVEKC